MWESASWIERLDHLPGLNMGEKARARVIILSKPREDRILYFEGTYAEAAATIKALLRETPMLNVEASASSLMFSDASALSLSSCCTTTTITPGGITTSRSSAKSLSNPAVSSASSAPTTTSSTTSSASRRPPAGALLLSAAASVCHLAALPAAFREAHLRASQPGDVYCRTVKKFVQYNVSDDIRLDGDGEDARIDGYEHVETRFAMVVGVSAPEKDGAPGAVIAVRIRAAVVKRQQLTSELTASKLKQQQQLQQQEEFEAEVVPDPRDGLEAVVARLERREVRMEDVLWWRRDSGKWGLWDGSPQRTACIMRYHQVCKEYRR